MIREYLKNCEKKYSVSRLGSDRTEQTHELIVKSNFQLHPRHSIKCMYMFESVRNFLNVFYRLIEIFQ